MFFILSLTLAGVETLRKLYDEKCAICSVYDREFNCKASRGRASNCRRMRARMRCSILSFRFAIISASCQLMLPRIIGAKGDELVKIPAPILEGLRQELSILLHSLMREVSRNT